MSHPPRVASTFRAWLDWSHAAVLRTNEGNYQTDLWNSVRSLRRCSSRRAASSATPGTVHATCQCRYETNLGRDDPRGFAATVASRKQTRSESSIICRVRVQVRDWAIIAMSSSIISQIWSMFTPDKITLAGRTCLSRTPLYGAFIVWSLLK